jgi:hypothetical protein
MLLTTQRDIDEAVEKYGMPLPLQARTAATANKDAANNADAHDNANAVVINADTHADANTDAEANAEHFPDGTTIADYPN